MVDTWFIYHSKANCWNCLIVCRFLLCGANHYHDSAKISCQKRWCKRLGKVLNSTFGVMNQVRREKGSMLTLVWSQPFSESCKKTFQKTLPQRTPSSWALVLRQWYKKVRSTGPPDLSKKKAKGGAFRTGIQQLFNMLFNSKLAR